MPKFKFLSPEKLEENFASIAQIKHKARLEQIQLIKAVIVNLQAPSNLTSQERFSELSNDEKSKIITGVMLYIKGQIYGSYIIRSAENSVVYTMINPAIGVSKENVLDDVSKREALLSFRNYLLAYPKEILESSSLTFKANQIAADICPIFASELQTMNLHTKLNQVKTEVKQAKLHRGEDNQNPEDFMDDKGKQRYREYMAKEAAEKKAAQQLQEKQLADAAASVSAAKTASPVKTVKAVKAASTVKKAPSVQLPTPAISSVTKIMSSVDANPRYASAEMLSMHAPAAKDLPKPRRRRAGPK